MIWAIWILAILLASQYAWSVKLAYSRDRYRESAKVLARELVELRSANLVPYEKPLTPCHPKPHDSPKRFSGPQLRRMAERVNAVDVEALQERPNSEILQEQG